MGNELDRSEMIESAKQTEIAGNSDSFALRAIDRIAKRNNFKTIDIRSLLVKNPSPESEEDKILEKLWYQSPEKNAANLPSYDMMEIETIFTEDELKKILPEIHSFELTADCNGECPFCGEKSILRRSVKGVTGKFSYNSIKTFIEKYRELLPEKDVFMYGLSDPFDYRDGEFNYLHVHKEWMKNKPNSSTEVTTSIPKGGQDDFVEFVNYLFNNDDPEHNQKINIRLSIAPHNISRIRATIDMAIDRLKAQGHEQEKIDEFFARYFSFEARFPDDILPVGMLVHRMDPFNSQETPTSYSSVRLGPPIMEGKEIRVQSMIWCATTKYTPTSFFSVPLNGERNIVGYEHISQYRADPRVIMGEKDFGLMPRPVDKSGRELLLPIDQREELYISREIRSLYLFLENVRNGCGLYFGSEMDNENEDREQTAEDGTVIKIGVVSEKGEEKDEQVKKAYLNRILQKYKERFADSLTELSNLPEDKASFYLDLYNCYRNKADFANELIEANMNSGVVESVLTILSNIDSQNKDNLPEILEYLRQVIRDHEKLGSNKETRDALLDFLSEKLNRGRKNYTFMSNVGGLVFALRGHAKSESEFMS